MLFDLVLFSWIVMFHLPPRSYAARHRDVGPELVRLVVWCRRRVVERMVLQHESCPAEPSSSIFPLPRIRVPLFQREVDHGGIAAEFVEDRDVRHRHVDSAKVGHIEL
jgi:hypothetical protein